MHGDNAKPCRLRNPRRRSPSEIFFHMGLIPFEQLWLRTNGVNANGAAAKVMNFDRLKKKVRPSTFGKIKVGLTGVPKGSLCQKTRNLQ